ncbi:hypothetical protein I4U23_017380 [Adineta vaga]|nr:hypothetical protein I4U23_017380 [Adineta vaga]
MILFKFFCILVWLYQINGIALDVKSGPEKLSLNNSVFNKEILTQFNYHGNEVYVYGAVSNNIKNSDAPGKWTFYYVPLMIPINNNRSEDKWIYTVENDVRIKLMLGNNEIKELAEKEIIKKYDPNITKYSQSWVIAPLMIDSLTAYIVRKINSPIKNVYPFKIENPDGLEIEFRFQCSSEILAKKIKKKIINEIYGIEVIFYFAGSRQVTINAISFTGEILKAIISRTVADGGKSNIKYIQRNQRAAFINKYKANIKTMSYIKKQNVHNPLMLITLRKQFHALLQQALISSTEIKLAVNFYNQIWSTYDLNPDRITREINKLFTYNKTATENRNHSDQYFDYQKENITLTTGSGGGGLIFKIFALNTRDEISELNSSSTTNIAKSVYSLSEIQDLLKQESIEITWTDEKFIVKSFLVYRLSDITDRLDLYINSQQLLAEKKAGGFARMINLRSHPLTVSQVQSTSFLGEIKLYLGNISSLPSHWMFCHGQNLSRIEYHKLFSVVGESFGAGDGHTTFNLPDLRGRVVIERNSSEKNTDATFQMGVTSDHAKHILTKEENSSVLLHSYQTLDYIIFIGDQSVTNMNPDGKKSIITSTFNITCSPQCLNDGYCTAPNVCTDYGRDPNIKFEEMKLSEI